MRGPWGFLLSLMPMNPVGSDATSTQLRFSLVPPLWLDFRHTTLMM
jgi:hypothetical protein